ncbi:MAG: hypothetical protein J7M26_05555 [Armatimonadetes bacterium]|nr:hypothetical protein [Armatimonadota bacterium]
MVPAKPLAEWLGAKLQTQGGQVRILQPRRGLRVTLVVGNKVAHCGEKISELPRAPEVRSEELLVPLRAFAEMLGTRVSTGGRWIHLVAPELGISADLLAPPPEGSDLASMWEVAASWFRLRGARVVAPWALFSARRKQKLLSEVGAEAPRLAQERFGNTKVLGIRIVGDGLGPKTRGGWLLAVVGRADGSASLTRLDLVYERAGWRVDRVRDEALPWAEPFGQRPQEQGEGIKQEDENIT